MPNLLLIAGNGRNVGKTFLACKIIKYLSQTTKVVGVKITTHFHEFNNDDVLIKTDDFIILNEKRLNKKDSSLMLQAGAKQVFFVMVKEEHLKNAIGWLKNQFSDEIVVCESGGLMEIVEPGDFLFVKRSGETIVKKNLLNYAPIVINNDGKDFGFDINIAAKEMLDRKTPI